MCIRDSPEAPQIVVDNKGYRTREVPPAAGTGISSLNAATTELYQQLKDCLL